MTRVIMLFGVAMVVIGGGAAWAGTTVHLKQNPVVDTGPVLLSEIADIESTEKGTPETLGEVRVGTTSRPGQRTTVDIDYIRLAIRQAGYNPDLLSIEPARDVMVEVECNRITGDELLAMATELVRQHLLYPPESVQITATNLPKEVLVGPGALSMTTTTQPNEDFIGYTFLSLNISVDGRLAKRVVLHLEVGVTAEVAVAAADIARGQILGEADVLFEQRDLASVGAGAVTNPVQVVGMTARTPIRRGQAILTRLLIAPPTICRGDVVNLQSVAGCVSVVTPAVAKQDGAMGDRILVHSQTTDRDIQAQVIDAHTVRVVARPTMAPMRRDTQ